jgi:signal peptidase I
MTTRTSRTLTYGGLGLVAVLALWASGFRGLAVESGSMGDAMPAGSLAITRPVATHTLRVGDVVSIDGADGRVTHRVVDVTSHPGHDSVQLVLQGDANTVPDPAPVVVVKSADRVLAVVPHAGSVLGVLTGVPALVVLGSGAVILLLRRRWAASGVVAVATTAVLVSTGATGAVFTDSATVASGALTSGQVNTPTLPTASQAAVTGIVNIGFTSTTVGTLGATPSSYEVYRYTAATGGTGTLVCTTTVIFTCTQTRTALTTGTHYYAVRAKFATEWFAESARRSYSHDATAPTVTVTRPLPGSAGGSVALRNSVTSGCTAGGVACGASADTGGGAVSTVQYTLLRNWTASGATTFACWNGSSWVSSSTGVCTFASTTGTTSWLVPGAPSTAYVNPGGGVTNSFVLSIRATDSFGNQTTTTVNFSL